MKKILVVDDDRLMLDLIGDCLRRASYEVETADNGADGLSSARTRRPDLVVLDLMMPDMHGFDVCQALRGDPAADGLKILILTAKNYEVDRRAAERMGADGYISKPFKIDALLSAVGRLLGSGKP